MRISVTGHRPNKLGNDYTLTSPLMMRIKDEMERIIYEYRPTHMISGMALGIDMLWASLAIEEDIPLIAAIPFHGQEAIWPKESKELYRSLLNRASEVKVICFGGYANWKMQKRNEWMVDNSDMVVAVWNGSPGGTHNCIKYAKTRKPIKYIDI